MSPKGDTQAHNLDKMTERVLKKSKIMSTGFLDFYTDHSDMMPFRVSGKSQLYEMKEGNLI